LSIEIKLETTRVTRETLIQCFLSRAREDSLWPTVSALSVDAEYDPIRGYTIVVGVGHVFQSFHESRDLPDLSVLWQSGIDLAFLMFEDANCDEIEGLE
jgi:hypothetical protein